MSMAQELTQIPLRGLMAHYHQLSSQDRRRGKDPTITLRFHAPSTATSLTAPRLMNASDCEQFDTDISMAR